MSELIESKLGPAELKLELVEGQIKLSIKYDGPGIDGEVACLVEPVFFLDKLKGIIPGQIDDAIIDGLKAALAPKPQ